MYYVGLLNEQHFDAKMLHKTIQKVFSGHSSETF